MPCGLRLIADVSGRDGGLLLGGNGGLGVAAGTGGGDTAGLTHRCVMHTLENLTEIHFCLPARFNVGGLVCVAGLLQQDSVLAMLSHPKPDRGKEVEPLLR